MKERHETDLSTPRKTAKAAAGTLEAERRLVSRAKSDPLAFGELYDRHHDAIFGYVLHRTANVALAQDLTANTFHKALEKLWTFRWRGIPFSAWLYRIAANEVAAHFRRHKHFRTEPLGQRITDIIDDISQADRELLAAEQQLSDEVMFNALHQAIAGLKPGYQEVIVLRYFEKKKVDEIAEIVGKPAGTVKSLIHRAVEKLRGALTGEIDDET